MTPADSHYIPPAVIEPASARAPSARGGYLLPPGYLSTSGSQIVDADGKPVRIASIGWSGTDGWAGAAPSGVVHTGYKTILDAIVADGFNTVRIPWTDVDLNAPMNGYEDRYGWINVTLNWDFVADHTPGANGHYKFVTVLEAFRLIVAYAGDIGLKVIFDHHSNEGTDGQQRNGLWFDLGPGSNGTDGVVKGTVTAATFKKNWVQLAAAFAGNSTVIGFDLHNEPNGTSGKITWGGGGPTDIKAMCENVGAAIQTVNPDALIICEGSEEYAPPAPSSGMKAGFAAPQGNLTGAGANPVVLPVPNKLVYSVHEYPSSISDVARWGIADSGEAYIERMTIAWGYLVRDNIAPVWIGEMGCSMRNKKEQAWAETVINYMNGEYGRFGGPTFTKGQQPVSGSWWLIGPSNDPPFGVQTQWGAGHYRPEQQAITDKMLMR